MQNAPLSPAKPNLKEILSLAAAELECLEDRLLNKICPDSRILCNIMQDIFKAGGKRLRPLIRFLSYKLLISESKITETEDYKEKSFLIAEISELIHTASLVHDDIIDNSLIRRGAPTTNSKWDNAVTVISGDFMFARAAVNLGKLECNEIVQIYAAVLEDLCSGEIEQVEKKYSTELDFDYYYSKSYKKTASLFEASAKAPAALLNAEQKHKEALANYGKELGIAFQVVDDILDYTSDEETLGKPAGSDIKDGQVTLPALYTLKELMESNAQAHQELESKISSLAHDNNQDHVTKVLEIIDSSNGIKESKKKAQEIVDTAIQELSVFKDSVYKEALINLANFVVSRTH